MPLRIIVDRNIPLVEKCFSRIGDVHALPDHAITAHELKSADILVCRATLKVDEDILAGSKVQFVATAVSGTDNIDLNYLHNRKIGFSSSPGSNAESVAEYVLCVLLHIALKYEILLSGKSIGIIGVGNIGHQVAEKVSVLGMKTILNDPPLARQTGDTRFLPLDDLYNCDFITVHTPLSVSGEDPTFHLINGKFFTNLKEGAFFINTSRGQVAANDAVKNALITRQLSGAVLDVWEGEPEIDVELLKLVDIGTPHIAGFSHDGRIRGMVTAFNAVCHYFGLHDNTDESAFLPRMKNKINFDSDSNSVQDLIAHAVQQAYRIEGDDANLRKITSIPHNQRSEYFRELRSQYSKRREFSSYQVRTAQSDSLIISTLSRLGFSISSVKG